MSTEFLLFTAGVQPDAETRSTAAEFLSYRDKFDKCTQSLDEFGTLYITYVPDSKVPDTLMSLTIKVTGELTCDVWQHQSKGSQSVAYTSYNHPTKETILALLRLLSNGTESDSK